MQQKPTYEELEQRLHELTSTKNQKSKKESDLDLARLNQQNRVIRTLSCINRLITTEKDPARLLATASKLMVENSGFSSAWIVLNRNQEKAESFFYAGFDKQFKPMAEALSTGPLTACAKLAIKIPGLHIHQNPLTDCTDCPLAAAYRGHGALTIQLAHDNHTFGCLSVSMLQEYIEDEQIKNLLTEVADDIAFALAKIDARKQYQILQQDYWSVIKNSPDAIIASDIDGTITLFNPGAEKMYGYRAAEIIGKHVSILCPENLRDQQKRLLQETLENESKSVFEFTQLTQKGRPFPVKMTLNTRYDTENRRIGLAAIVRDILDRKQSELALDASEVRFNELVNTIKSGVAVYEVKNDGRLGRDYIIKDFNKAALRIEEKTKGDVIGKSLFDIRPNIDEFGLIPIFRDVWKTGKAANYPAKVYSDENYCNWYENWVYRLPNGEIVAVYDDVTEQEQAKEELRESKETAESYLNVAAEIILSLDKDGTILLLNASGHQLLGYPDGTLIGKNWFDTCLPPEIRATIRDLLLKLWENKSENAATHENPVLLHDGSKRIISWHNTMLRDKTGKGVAALTSGIDITERCRAEAERKRLAERLTLATDSAGIGVWDFDLVNNVLIWDDWMYRLHGVQSENFGGAYEAWKVGLHPEDRERAVKEVELAIAGKKEFNTQFRIIQPGGKIRYLRAFAVVVRDGTGTPVRMTGINYDITQRKHTEKELQDSEEKYRHLSDATFEAIFFSEKGICTGQNKTAQKMFGYTDEEALGRPATDWIHPDFQKQVINYIKADKTEPYEALAVRKDGSPFPCEIQARTSINAGKKIRITALRDITARKKAEVALKNSEEKFRSIFNNSVVGFFRTTPDGKIIWANPALTRMLGFNSYEELEQRNLAREGFFAACPREEFEHEIRLKGQVTDRESIWLKKDGTELQVSENVKAIYDDSGKIIYYDGTAMDITERKRLEKEKIKLEEQYRQSQKVEAIGRLAGGVAHDLNNLLTPILGYGQMLISERETEDETWECLNEINEAAIRARDLVRQLLAFSRKQILEYQIVDLNQVVVGFEKLLRRTIREDIDIQVILSPTLSSVKADVGQIEQVVMNLAVNAQDAMPDGGHLSIETNMVYLDEAYAATHPETPVGTYTMLAVSDTGIGMNEALSRQIFEPFFSTKGDYGTGLGLATVYGIIKQHDGSIQVYSERGCGTTFKIYLPAIPDETGKTEKTSKRPLSIPGTETVLVVEDNSKVRLMACKILKRHGYTVFRAKNGQEALAILDEHKSDIQLLLTDVVMPEMNGRILYETAHIQCPQMKVLYMSGYTDNVIVHQGVLDKGVSFIQKPFSVTALTEKVRQVLDGEEFFRNKGQQCDRDRKNSSHEFLKGSLT